MSIAVLSVILSSRVAGQSSSVTVVTTELAPFVERSPAGAADGFYFEIWEDVAQSLDLDYEVMWTDSFDEMLSELEAGRADVAVAPLAPTSAREPRFDFSSAVITSGPQLGAHDRTRRGVSLISTLLSSGALRVVLIAMLGLVILGHLIWLVERRDPDISDFHPTWPRGVFDGMWWAAVTVTTVGYGDMSPKSWRGRTVGLLAMFASLFLVGAFVSQVTADLSRARDELQVENLDEIDDQRIGTVAGSTFETYLVDRDFAIQSYDSQAAVFDAAEAGEIDFVVANPYALAAIGADYGLVGVGDVFFEEFETFGLQQDSPWREPINAALADLQSSGQVQRVIDRWVSDD